MKINMKTISQLSVAATALAISTAAFAQNPRQVPPVPGQTPDPRTANTAANAASSRANSRQGANLSTQDRDFMKKAAQGGMEEVEMGRMAEQQGQSADVKAFGKRMVAEHSKANDELMAIARKKGVQLTTHPPKKEKMSGPDFDKKYMADMIKDHEKDLAEFRSESQNGSDPDLKAFASKGAKMVQKHLDLAKADQGKLK